MSKKDESKELVLHEPKKFELAIPPVVDIGDLQLSDDDFGGHEEHEAPLYPYLSIRQKMPREDKKAEWKIGGFKISNHPSGDVPDINPPIQFVILFWSKVRVYFPEGAEEPYCKSIDGKIGSTQCAETAMGNCLKCLYSQWTDGKAGECKEGRNLYVFHPEIGPAIVRLGPSALKPWRAFANLMQALKVDTTKGRVEAPLHLSIIEVSETTKLSRPGLDPYYVPVFKHAGFIQDADMLATIRAARGQRGTYDETATKSELGVEDVNGVKPADEKMPWDD